jgi:hypothetical protein
MTREMLIFAAGSVGITKKPWRMVWDQVHGGAYWDSQVRVDDRATIWVAEDHPGFPKPDSKGECMHHMPGGGYGWEWNPWYLDDDAMRLVVALGMTVEVNREVGQVTVQYRLPDDPTLLSLIEHSDVDLEACARHAIVRAAADIGQRLFGKKVVINLDVPYRDKKDGDGTTTATFCSLEHELDTLATEVNRLNNLISHRAPHYIEPGE